MASKLLAALAPMKKWNISRMNSARTLLSITRRNLRHRFLLNTLSTSTLTTLTGRRSILLLRLGSLELDSWFVTYVFIIRDLFSVQTSSAGPFPITLVKEDRTALRCVLRSFSKQTLIHEIAKNTPEIFRREYRVFGVNEYLLAERYGTADAVDTLVKLIRSGDIKLKEHITNGLENAAAAFAELLTGGNTGKAVVVVSE